MYQDEYDINDRFPVVLESTNTINNSKDCTKGESIEKAI